MTNLRVLVIGSERYYSKILNAMQEAISEQAMGEIALRVSRIWNPRYLEDFDYTHVFIVSDAFTCSDEGYDQREGLGVAAFLAEQNIDLVERITGTSMMRVHAIEWKRAGFRYEHTSNLYPRYFKRMLQNLN